MKFAIFILSIYLFIFFFKLLLDCYYLPIELWQETLFALICSFLRGNCFGQYITFMTMKRRFHEIDDFFQHYLFVKNP